LQSTIKNQQINNFIDCYSLSIPSSMTTRTRADILLLAGICSFLFFYGLAQFGLIGADEPRYAQVAREMLARRDWITPVLGGQPWLEKPPLYYWQEMLAYLLFGVSDWAARIPSAFDATVMVAAIYCFFRRSHPRVALDAALISASCAGVIAYARAASMDMALTTTFTVAMLAWWIWRESGKKTWLAVFYACLSLGTLAKGPVAPFLAALVLAVYATGCREFRRLLKTLWLPGILLFLVIALPWYVAVQIRNPSFFQQFILQHNLARFSKDLYHHREPFWYYLPVTLLALIPWTIFVVAAGIPAARNGWRKPSPEAGPESQFRAFAFCWLIVPVLFFSISQSKLPGYILPALPAGALLLAGYLRERQESKQPQSVSKWLIILHALLAAMPFVPALLLTYLVTQHRLPGGTPLFLTLGGAFMLAAGIAVTLARPPGLRMLRFVTLIPVLLSVTAVLKIGSTALDQTLSARPVAREIAGIEMHPLLLAVYGVPRELEYGLTFYGNQWTIRYEWGNIPTNEHLLIAPENWQAEVAAKTAGRRVSFLGNYAPQHVNYYWISAANQASARPAAPSPGAAAALNASFGARGARAHVGSKPASYPVPDVFHLIPHGITEIFAGSRRKQDPSADSHSYPGGKHHHIPQGIVFADDHCSSLIGKISNLFRNVVRPIPQLSGGPVGLIHDVDGGFQDCFHQVVHF
jgi:4-amino-4-deoxy-L-arabinose transferase-like glycosyltransferase